MAHHRDAQLPEVVPVAHTREQEHLRGVDGAPAQNHVHAGVSLEEAQACSSQFLRSQTEPQEPGLGLMSLLPSPRGRQRRLSGPPCEALGRRSAGVRFLMFCDRRAQRRS